MSAWRGVLGNFTAALIALATVAGTFLAAQAAHVLWLFWLLVVAALLFALIRLAVPRVVSQWHHIRTLLRLGVDHPRVMKVAAASQARVEDLLKDLEAAHAGLERQRAAGVLDGRRRVLGEILASETDTDLILVGIAVADERLLLAATFTGEPPAIGGRWFLLVKGTSLVHGAFRVEEIDRDFAQLALDEVRDATAIKSLQRQAKASNDAPNSLELRRREFVVATELEQEL